MATTPVQSVDRALDLLEALGEAERSLSLAEVAGRTGLTPPKAGAAQTYPLDDKQQGAGS